MPRYYQPIQLPEPDEQHSLWDIITYICIILTVIPSASMISTLFFAICGNREGIELVGFIAEILLAPFGWYLARTCNRRSYKVAYFASWGVMLSFILYGMRMIRWWLTVLVANLCFGASFVIIVALVALLYLKQKENKLKKAQYSPIDWRQYILAGYTFVHRFWIYRLSPWLEQLFINLKENIVVQYIWWCIRKPENAWTHIKSVVVYWLDRLAAHIESKNQNLSQKNTEEDPD